MKTFNKFITESDSLERTLRAVIWPAGLANDSHDQAIMNMHLDLMSVHDYPVEQRQDGLPFRDDMIQHRTGYLAGTSPVTNVPKMDEEQVQTLNDAELSEEEVSARNVIVKKLNEDIDAFSEIYGKNVLKATNALATQMMLEQKLVKLVSEQKQVPPVLKNTLQYFTEETKDTGSSDVETTPKDESSALVIAKKYDDLAKNTDGPKLANVYSLTAQRFYDTASRLRAFKKRRTGEPKQRLKEEFDSFTELLEHVISTSDDYDMKLEESEETITITPELAGQLYNHINGLNEEEQMQFIEQITESEEALKALILNEEPGYDNTAFKKASDGPKDNFRYGNYNHQLYKAYDKHLKSEGTNHTKMQAKKYFMKHGSSMSDAEEHVKKYESWKANGLDK